MRNEFNNLVETLKTWDLYQVGDEVDIAISELESTIAEVEKRMKCIEKCAEEINEAIGGYTSSVDNYETFVMSGSDIEIIMRGSHDIEIALDLNNTEVIENNWYDLFKPKAKVLIPKDSIVEWKETRQYYSVNGGAKARVTEDYTTEHESDDKCIQVEWLDEKAKGQVSGGYILGMFKEDFERPSVPTFLCHSDDIHNVVKDIIAKLKVIDVDGETMQYILKEVGMEDQMLRQLVMSNPESDTKDLLEEKKELNNKSVRGCIEI
jgi:hypothetical protein